MPALGYLLAGRMTVRYADRDEVVEAGDLYDTAPGHTIAVDAGTELLECSPMGTFEETAAVAERNLAALADAEEQTS